MASLKSAMPDVPITLFTDQSEVECSNADRILPVSDPANDYGDKILPLANTPYDRTLFLDSDTYVCEDVSPLFEILDRVDIAMAHGPIRSSYSVGDTSVPGGVPAAFAEFNTGVILFRKSSQLLNAFEDWNQQYKTERRLVAEGTKEGRFLNDQPFLRKVLYHSDLRFATLGPEYNCCFTSPGFLCGTVKIIHGRHPKMADIENQLNRETGFRIHMLDAGKIILSGTPKGWREWLPGPAAIGRVIRYSRVYGARKALQRLLKAVRRRS